MHTFIRNYSQYVLTLLVCWAVLPISASQAQDNPNVHEVTTAAPLLRISPDARSAALGEAGLATTADAASAMVNGAKAVFSEAQTAIMLNYSPWLRDISSDAYLLSLSGYQKLDDRQAITASLRYFTSGKVEDRDFNNNLVQLLTPTEFSIDAGYTRMLSDQFSVGIAFRYINSSIGKTVSNISGAANAFAADLSAYYNGLDDDGRGVTAGLNIANIGTGKIKYGETGNDGGYLPARIGVGAGYHIPFQNNDRIGFTVDVNKSLVPLMPSGDDGFEKLMNYSVLESYGKGIGNEALSVSAGAEYNYQDLFAFRAGYFAETKAYGGRSYLAVGAGVFYGQAGLNLAYIIPSGSGVNRNALSNTLRLGIAFNFID